MSLGYVNMSVGFTGDEVEVVKDAGMVSDAEDYATSGPLSRLFRNATARILDQSMVVGGMEQTISMLAESTDLSYKTVAQEVERFVELGYMCEGRRMGNARTWRFNVDNHLSGLIACAEKMQLKRLREEA